MSRTNAKWARSHEGLSTSRVVDIALTSLRDWYERMVKVADSPEAHAKQAIEALRIGEQPEPTDAEHLYRLLFPEETA